jgi:LL-diaminopimelate aminotransferase
MRVMASPVSTSSARPIAPQTEALRRLPPYVFAELDRLKAAARARGATLVDLGIGSPDLPMAPGVVAALDEAARNPLTHGYPAFRCAPEFYDAVVSFMQGRFGVTVDPVQQVMALSGAKEGLAQLAMAICAPGDLVLIPEIYYPVYARSVWLTGAEVRWVPMRAEDGFVLDLDAIAEEDAQRARFLIVNYPNNPTGARVEREFFETAVAFARRHQMLLVSDLAYSELTFDGTPAPSALECDPEAQVTIEFHSCSKTFSMAGLRVGFAVGNRTRSRRSLPTARMSATARRQWRNMRRPTRCTTARSSCRGRCGSISGAAMRR